MPDEFDDVREVEPGLSDQYRKASPWPMLVAFGFVLSEVGVVLGYFPVAVGGLLLFGGTAAGILSESGYVEQMWRSLVGFGLVLAALGALAIGLNIDVAAVSVDALLDTARPFVYRGSAIAAAGVMLVAAGVTLKLVQPTRPSP
jgi:Sec-independent protein secretion pathway component TatC